MAHGSGVPPGGGGARDGRDERRGRARARRRPGRAVEDDGAAHELGAAPGGEQADVGAQAAAEDRSTAPRWASAVSTSPISTSQK